MFAEQADMRMVSRTWMLVTMLASAAALGDVPQTFVSQARWIYAAAGTDGKTPVPGCVRLCFDVPAGEVATNAWFYVYQNGPDGIWVNGRSAKAEVPDEFNRHGGWIKGVKVSFAREIRTGRNALAFRMKDKDPRYQGMILRGEVAFRSGKKIGLFSNASQAKAGAEVSEDWMCADFDDSGWKPAFERGDVMMSQWKNAGPIDRLYATEEERRSVRERDTRGFPEKALLSEPESPNARVVYHGTVPGIEINGEVLPPYTMAEVQFGVDAETVERDQVLKACREDGIRFLCLPKMRMSECCPAEGQYDFSSYDTGIRTILARYPEAYVVIYFRNGVDLPDWWMRRHGDELCGFARFSKNKKTDNYSANPDVPSLASQEHRRFQREFIRAFGAFARRQPWGRRIAAIHCGYGASGDGMPCGSHALPDTGKCMTESFRQYLFQAYADDAALQRAWGDPSVTRSTATVPDLAAREGSGCWIRDLADGRDRRLADYHDCYHRVFSSFVIDFCKSVKEALPGCLAGAYHGYVLLGYTPEGSTARYREILASPYVDYMFATVHGNSRMDGMSRHLISSFHRYGKLSSMEGDDRVYRSYLPGQWANLSRKPLSVITNSASYQTPLETRSTVTKIVGNALIGGCSFQMVDFGKAGVKWFNCPEVREPLAVAVREWRRIWDDPPKPAADVAVVLDPDQIWKEGSCNDDVSRYVDGCLSVFPRQSLNFSGYAVDTYAPEDFIDARRNYKAVVLLNLFEADETLKKALRCQLDRKGVTAIWCYAPGLRTDAGFDEKNMESLTGIHLKVRRESLPLEAKDSSGREFAVFSGGRYSAPNGRKVISPRVWADDPKVEVLARYADDGTAAAVRKHLAGGGTSVFTGIPVHDSRRWAELLSAAGCHAWTSPGFFVRRDSRYLMVYSGKGRGSAPGWANDVLKGQLDESGRVEVDLWAKCAEVRDVMTGEVLARNADRLVLESDVPRTWLMQVVDCQEGE